MKTLKKISICLLAIISLTLVSCMQEEKPKEEKQQKGPQHTEDFWVKNWLRSEVFYYHEEINELFDNLYLDPLKSERGVVTYDDVLYFFWNDGFSKILFDNYKEISFLVTGFHPNSYNVDDYKNRILFKLGADKSYENKYPTYGSWAFFKDIRGVSDSDRFKKIDEIKKLNKLARNVANPEMLIDDICKLWDLRKQFYESQTMERIQVFEWKLIPTDSENFKDYNVIYKLKDDKVKTRYALIDFVEFKDGRYEVRLLKKAKVISELYQ